MIGSKGDAMVRPGWSEGGARVKQRSSKGSNSSMKGGEGCTNLIPKTMHIYSHCLRSPLLSIRYPLPFSFLHGCFLFSPSVPVPRRMLGAERVERSEKRWKNGEG